MHKITLDPGEAHQCVVALQTAAVVSRENGHEDQADEFRVLWVSLQKRIAEHEEAARTPFRPYWA